MSNSQLLIELQQIDLDAMRLRKRLQELPERKDLEAVNAKIAEVFAKSQQVSRMRNDADIELNKLSEEDARLVEKAKELQAKIDETTDFRLINTVTRDLEGALKRRNKVEFDSNKIMEKLDKISDVEDQVAKATEVLQRQKEAIEAKIGQQEAEAKDTVIELVTRRKAIIEALPADLIENYENIRKTRSGIAIATMEAGHCSVCRVEFHKAQLDEFRNGPAITKCPNCYRIFIAREED